MMKHTAESKTHHQVIPVETIAEKIYLIRNNKVMIDADLANLYGVKIKALNQAVSRNMERFPDDFVFQLTRDESKELLRSQFVTLKRGQHRKYQPYAFTEQGVAMLSSVLRSKRAVQVNIAIMRTFVRIREVLSTHKDLVRKLDDLEQKYAAHDERIRQIFSYIKKLVAFPAKHHRQIGFTPAKHRGR